MAYTKALDMQIYKKCFAKRKELNKNLIVQMISIVLFHS